MGTAGSSAPGRAEPRQRTVVTEKTEIATGIVELALMAAGGGVLPGWAPGSHIDLVLPGGLVRQYSLIPSSSEKEWRVAVLHEVAGRGGSRYVHEVLAPGDELETRGPRNHFAVASSRQHLFLAGGIGITPLLSMIEDVDDRGEEWSLVYCGRTRASMALVADLQDRWPERITINPDDECGLFDVAAHLCRPLLDATVYACGPVPFLDAVREATRTWRPGALRVERFAPAEQHGLGPATGFEVELRASGRTIAVPPDRSVLEMVREAGLDVPSSCEEGACGACESRVLEGEVDHRDVVLSPEEQARSESMMICVSRARGARLTLDL